MNKHRLLKQLKRLSVVTGREEGCKITFSGNGAYYDSQNKVINFPIGDFSDPDYLMLVNGLSDHENGHARFTDKIEDGYWNSLEKGSDKFINSFRNLFEDIRMEQLVMKTFPGSRSNLADTVKMAIKFGLFQEPSTEGINAISEYYLYGLRHEKLAQTTLAEWAAQAKQNVGKVFPDIIGGLHSIYERAKCTQSNLECFELAKELYELIKEASESENDEDQDQDGSSENNDDRDSNSDSENESQQDSDSENENEQGDQDNGDNENNADSDGGTDTEPQEISVESDLQISTTPCSDVLNADPSQLPCDLHEALMDKMDELCKDLPVSKIHTKLLPISTILDNEGDSTDARLATKLSRPIKQTLMRILHQQNKVERGLVERGRQLSPQRLASIPCGTKEVFKTEKKHKAPNLAITVLVDKSSSMNEKEKAATHHRMALANIAALALCKALEQIKGVSYEVGYYPDYGNIYLAKGFEQKLQADRFNVHALGTTPTGEAMQPMLTRLAARKEPIKKMIVITDGGCNKEQVVLHSIEFAKQFGIEVYAIGIDTMIRDGFEEVPFVHLEQAEKLNIVLRDLIKQ